MALSRPLSSDILAANNAIQELLKTQAIHEMEIDFLNKQLSAARQEVGHL
jgi:hypothetical protein